MPSPTIFFKVHWTAETEAAMLEGGNEGVHRYHEQLVGQLNDMVYLIRGKLSKMARVTIGALAVIDVHARDVMKKVRKNSYQMDRLCCRGNKCWAWCYRVACLCCRYMGPKWYLLRKAWWTFDLCTIAQNNH